MALLRIETAAARLLLAASLLLTVLPAFAVTPVDASATKSDGRALQALALIRSWVTGRYDNAAQTERDLA